MTRSRRCTTLMMFAAISVAFRVAVPIAQANAFPADPRHMVRLPGHVLPALAKAVEVDATAKQLRDIESEPITLTLVLKRDDQRGFETYLRDVYDRQSPRFQRFLPQSEIADRFGPSRGDYESALRYMRASGFKLLRGSTNRLTITVRGTRAAAERAFAVKVRDYRIGERSFFANDRDPALPRALSAEVQAIVGLADLATPKPASTSLAGALAEEFGGVIGELQSLILENPVPFDAINVESRFASLQAAFLENEVSDTVTILAAEEALFVARTHGATTSNVGNVVPSGVGQKIGLVAFSSFQMSDVSDFLTIANLPANLLSQVSKVDVGGGAALQPGEPGESDVLLGIEMALLTAPSAQVIVYDGPSTGSAADFEAILNQMIGDGINVIANSFVYCEDQTTQADAQAIDSVLANAAASGISAFSATGDHGSACSDGTTNTIAVPADSPNITAVGASSISIGPGETFDGESYLDESAATPPGAQSGLGLSAYFARPTYQDALNSPAMRSVPDVVLPGDTAHGASICEADAGGCLNGLRYGGTSRTTAKWAAIAALLDEAAGHPLGLLNPLIYPLAGTDSFHSPASMGTDFAHVGLGSPNVDVLKLALTGQSAGAPDASVSTVKTMSSNPFAPFAGDIPDDGSTAGAVVVKLLDSNSNVIPGKAISLSGNAGSHVSIMPANAVTSVINGTVTFTVTDSTAEDVTFTATDTSDGVILTTQPVVHFVAPPATAAGIGGGPPSVSADGTSAASIIVTLKDSLGRPTPGKLVTLSQTGGSSVISAPSPNVTDGAGQITFSTTDVKTESITYTATDVPDGNLPVPGSVHVDFTGGSGCAGGSPSPMPGYAVESFATGFTAQSFFFGNVNFGCSGALGLAFDPSGNLYVAHAPTGNLYKFPPTGGVADSGTLVTSTALGPATLGLAFDKNGNLFATRAATTGDFTTGDVIQVDPSTGAIIREVATGLVCPWDLATDPISGDLFTGDACTGSGSDRTTIWRISNPGGPSPTTSVYANTPGQDNFGITFAPDGTMYVITRNFDVARITGTAAPQPPTVTILPNVTWGDVGIAAGGMQPNGDAQFLLLNNPSGPPMNLETFDLTTDPPSNGVQIAGSFGALDDKIIGPDGCLYSAAGLAVYRFSNDGRCNFGPTTQPPALSLTPTSATPAQGSTQNLTATFHHGIPPAGTPVNLAVVGNNLAVLNAKTDSSGQASFAYTGVFLGADTVVASAKINDVAVASNKVQVDWQQGKDLTFVTLSPSATSGENAKPTRVKASLTDVSQSPPTPLSGHIIDFALGGSGQSVGQCSAMTDANGTAACQLTPATPGIAPLTATFAGTNALAGSSASAAFNVVGRPCAPLDCNDADPCTADTCNDGQCAHVAPKGFDGATCYVGAALMALDAAGATDVNKRTKAQIHTKLTKIGTLIQRARGGGKKGKRARKKADHLLAALERKVGKLPSKKLAQAVATQLVRFIGDAKSALEMA
jgi:hypothetical protein